ncbi:hypothetical protein VHEMI10623 [[Torrubiella] hemipterigena]|uniref:Secreted protein n=1 Tax=[Torrubiella] hemipterigena TaxID=1531966 RepID=A0A0A1TS71_9HYPO|nr:hypothetical protein VHEMI10623 [[Torrubiella] hemipterigena]
MFVSISFISWKAGFHLCRVCICICNDVRPTTIMAVESFRCKPALWHPPTTPMCNCRTRAMLHSTWLSICRNVAYMNSL